MTEPLERAWREERAAIVATLSRRFGDIDLAEDATQDAFAAAMIRWPADGVPDAPGAWLMRTAWRKAIDRIRRVRPTDDVSHAHELADEVAYDTWGDAADALVSDDVLRLMLVCCHPALAPEARVALTLRHVAGLTAREIASAFLLPEQTMEKRLVRARAKVRESRISFDLPPQHALNERIGDVMTVLYVVFTEGYKASTDGPPIRADLCQDAIWLARQLRALVPSDMEVIGLLALLLLQSARTAARQRGDGSLILFDQQDRAQWDRQAIADAKSLMAHTGRGPLGPYQVEAAIALLHATAHDVNQVPWARIAELYAIRSRLAPSAVVTVNHAYAVGRALGPESGLAILRTATLDPALANYLPRFAVEAELLELRGDMPNATRLWREALRCATHAAQRAEIARRLADLERR